MKWILSANMKSGLWLTSFLQAEKRFQVDGYTVLNITQMERLASTSRALLPVVSHHQALIRLLLYLKGTLSYGITLGGKAAPLRGFADADHKRKGDCRSTSGYVFLLSQGPISWRSTTQRHPALSSCESEYVALSLATQEALWLRSLLKELDLLPDNPTTIYGDNQGSLKLAQHPYDHCRTKHINLHYHFIKSYITSKDIILYYCPTHNNTADVMTKALEPATHHRLLNLFPVSDCPEVLK
jgi:hypothetical protein